MRISVFGTGYLRAVHATCMAHLGHDVVAYDTDESKIPTLAAGRPPFYKPGLEDLLAEVLETGRLRFTDSAVEAASGAAVHFICIGTPQQPDSDAADVWYVDSAVKTVAMHADFEGLIVGKSTVPVGTAQRLGRDLADLPSEHRLEVAWNPEFLREGKAIEDTLRPDRLVFGVTSQYAEKVLLEVYRRLVDDGTPHLTADLATVEMVKAAANSFWPPRSCSSTRWPRCARRSTPMLCCSARRSVTTTGSAGDSWTPAWASAGDAYPRTSVPSAPGPVNSGLRGRSPSCTRSTRSTSAGARRRCRWRARSSVASSSAATLPSSVRRSNRTVTTYDSPALNVAAAVHLKGANVLVHDPKAITNARARFPTLTYCVDLEEPPQRRSDRAGHRMGRVPGDRPGGLPPANPFTPPARHPQRRRPRLLVEYAMAGLRAGPGCVECLI